MADKEYIIRTKGTVVDDSSVEIRNPQPFDEAILNASRAVEELDRYDDFDSLKIDTYSYKFNGKYGIKNDRTIHINTNDVILAHQKKAATEFLSHLRGFGLLGDCVGSGKTFEAGIVLSELAIREKIKSMLLIVPEQVFTEWVDVIETRFGLGKGVLKVLKEEAYFQDDSQSSLDEIVVGDKVLVRPKASYIVTTENFAKWTEGRLKNVVFDVIVVDEAHHLCIENGAYARSLKLLSILMQSKKLANIPYCILTSATPHSGNLEQMFRLWYFIRCKGGNPPDFDEKEDKDRTREYIEEKKYYMDVVCKGAPTVAEFIENAKEQILEGTEDIRSRYWNDYVGYLIAHEIPLEKYDDLSKGEKRKYRREYLEEHEDINELIRKDIAKEYHEKVMRSIMIRQAKTYNIAKREVQNIYFLPTSLEINLNKKEGFSNICPGAILIQADGDESYYTIESTFKNLKNHINNLEIFKKKNSTRYYSQQFTEANRNNGGAFNKIIVLSSKDSIVEAKCKEFVKIANEFKDERIITFFDYDNKNEEHNWDILNEYITNNAPELKDRIIMSSSNNSKRAIIESFENNPNSILLVCDPAFTEGANFQVCNKLVNFDVTNDPLAMDQRIGRVFRIGQVKNVKVISLAQMNALEGYCLAYFDRIGLLSSTNGDATIIAGSNNEHMKAIKCPACGRVELISESDYEERKLRGTLYCDETSQCRQRNPRGSLMTEINVYEFKCDTCGEILSRAPGDKGYQCFSYSNSDKGKLINEINKRDYGCSKICAIRHCERFRNNEILRKNCKIFNARTDVDITTAVESCIECNIKDECLQKCRVKGNETIEESIAECTFCEHAECEPKPYILKFDKHWTVKCPKNSCGGTLRPIISHTFAAYIKAAYEFNDGGSSFCTNLLNEAKKTSEIRAILSQDEEDSYE